MDISMQGITIGPLEIRFYSLMILSGLVAGVLLAQREARRLGENPDHVLNIAVLGAVFGIIGARLYHVIHLWEFYSQNPGRIIAVWNGGLGIFGAIAGAALALITYVWFVNRQARLHPRSGTRPMRMLRWFDIGAPAFLLGQAVGRWGNFFNQELFGPPTDLPWGIPIDPINRPSQYLDATHFHPLFLYESLLSLLGVIVLLYIARRLHHRLREGDILLGYFIWYSGARFLYEFLRIDETLWRLGPIPMAQVISLLLIVVATGILVWRHRQPAPPPPEEDPHDGPLTRSRTAIRRQRRRGEVA